VTQPLTVGFICACCGGTGKEPDGLAVTQRALPEQVPRVETGAVRFGDDWPGVFIRGDNALAYAIYLSRRVRGYDAFADVALDGLARVLAGCEHGAEVEP
jgi:hypothetical protein